MGLRSTSDDRNYGLMALPRAVRRNRLHGDRGDSGPLEAVILVPVLLAVFGLILFFGRGTDADNSVEHAAASGARAAAAAQTLGGAQQRADQVVGRTLGNSGAECSSWSAAVSGDLGSGGRVTVTVTCVVAAGDLGSVIKVPGSVTMTASASEPVDRVRGGS